MCQEKELQLARREQASVAGESRVAFPVDCGEAHERRKLAALSSARLAASVCSASLRPFTSGLRLPDVAILLIR